LNEGQRAKGEGQKKKEELQISWIYKAIPFNFYINSDIGDLVMPGENANDDVKQKRKPFNICDRTFEFALQIVNLCSALNQQPGINWILSKQLLRSGTSIGANGEEAQDGQSRADFISKYSIARKETRETIYWLRLVAAGPTGEYPIIPNLLSEATELYKILSSIIRNTKGL
jgi:four helix bundle protein